MSGQPGTLCKPTKNKDPESGCTGVLAYMCAVQVFEVLLVHMYILVSRLNSALTAFFLKHIFFSQSLKKKKMLTQQQEIKSSWI